MLEMHLTACSVKGRIRIGSRPVTQQTMGIEKAKILIAHTRHLH